MLLFSFQFIIIAALVAVALASDKYPKPYPKPAYPAYPAYAKSYDYVISSPTRNISNAFCLIDFFLQAPMPYSFDWSVKDEPSYNDFGHKETSNGKVVTGSYFLLLPDGRKQIVTYRADDYGYVADVKYEGEAKYPEYKPAYKPAYPAYPKASYPEPSYPKPTYTPPAYPKASYPEPAYPKPSYPSYPRPSYPSYPRPSYPSYPSYPRPTYPTTAAPVAEVEAAPAVKEAEVAVETPVVEAVAVAVAEPAVEAAPEVSVAAEPEIKATAEPETATEALWIYLDDVRR